MNMKNRINKQAVSVVLLCLAAVIIAVTLSGLLCPDREATPYPFDKNIGSYNPYEQQFDAFMKGQLHIDAEPSDELLELHNPYDPYERDGVDYLWDRALYDGKYYSYFGIAPIITVYYPYYLATGSLPSDDTVSAVFTVMTALFFSMAAVKLWSMLGKKAPLWLLWMLTLSGLFATQVFLVMRGESRFYYIATSSGMAFLSMFAWLFLSGISGTVCLDNREEGKEKGFVRPLIFTFAGISYGMCFLSRFNMALAAAFVILPMLWFYIAKQRREERYEWREIKKVAAELICLALPVALAISLQLMMNYARFDSFFEFGTTYQLTVSDVSKNKLRISDLGYAIYHYFLQPLDYARDFPFASLLYSALENYGRPVYIDTGMGLLSIPLMWLLLASAFVLSNKKTSRGLKATLACALFGILFVAWFNFCLGGVIFRYTCDLTLVGSLAALAVAFLLAGEGGEHRRGVRGALAAVALVSAFVSLTLAFSRNVNLSEYPQEVYHAFRAIFGK